MIAFTQWRKVDVMRMTIGAMLGLACAISGGIAQAVEHTKDSLVAVRKNIDSDKAVLIDVREKDEWDEGRLKEATLVPLSELEDAAKGDDVAKLKDTLPKKKIIYCHCRSGFRAMAAGKILAGWGFDVRPLKYGYEELVEARFPKAP